MITELATVNIKILLLILALKGDNSAHIINSYLT